jgi:hypothetical protein
MAGGGIRGGMSAIGVECSIVGMNDPGADG